MTRAAPVPSITMKTPLLLSDAAMVACPHGTISVRTLRAERDKGNLDTFMIGKREYTTLADLEKMVERCRAKRLQPASGLDRPAQDALQPGSSLMEESRSAQAAALASVKRLKKRLKTTSVKSASGNVAEVIRPKFG